MEQSDSSDAEKKKVVPEAGVTGSGDASGNASEEVEPTGTPTADDTKANTEPECSSVLSTTEPAPTMQAHKSVVSGDAGIRSPEAEQSTKHEIVSIEVPRDDFITTETKSPQEEIVDSLAENGIVSCTAELKQDRPDAIRVNEDISSQLEVDSHPTVNNEVETKKEIDEKPSGTTEKCVSAEVAAVEENVVKSEVVDAKVEVQDSNPEGNDSEECTPHENVFTSTDMNETKSVGPSAVDCNDDELIPGESAKQGGIPSITLPAGDDVEIRNSSSDVPTEALVLHVGKTSDAEPDGDRVVSPQSMEVDEVISECGTGDVTTTEEPMETEEVFDSNVVGNNEVVSGTIRSDCAPVVPHETAEFGRCSALPERQTDETVTTSEVKEVDSADCKLELDGALPSEGVDILPGTDTDCPQHEDNASTKEPSTALPDSANSTCSVLPDRKPCSPSAPPALPEEPPQAVPADFSTAVPADLSTAVPTDLSTAVPTDFSTPVPMDLSTAVPADLSLAVPEDPQQVVPEDLSMAVPADLSTAVPANLSMAVPEDPLLAVPDDPQPPVPEDLSTAIPADPPQAVPEDQPLTVPEDLLLGIPADLSTAVPADLSTAVPEDLSPAVLDDTQSAVAADLSPAVRDDPQPAVLDDPQSAVREDPAPAVREDLPTAVPDDPQPAVPDLDATLPVEPEEVKQTPPDDSPSIQGVTTSAAVPTEPCSSLNSEDDRHQYNSTANSSVTMVTGSTETVPVEDELNAGQQNRCPPTGTTVW